MSQRSRLLTLALVLTLFGLSCGSGRSVEAFCETFEEESRRLSEKYNDRAAQVEAEEGLVGVAIALGSLFEAQGDIVVLFDRLERTAPEEIAPDVAAVRDAVQKQADATATGDPLQMLFGGAVTALQTSGSAGRVDDYLRQNCEQGQ